MSLAENLLNSLDETAYSSVSVSNVVEEEHIIIDNARIMIVPSSLKTIAVTGDKDIETVTFDCVRYWDEHDFATFALYINYTLPNGNTGTYIPQNVSASEDHISFTWTIERYITLEAGRLTVSIEVVKTDESGNVLYQWGSIPNSDMTIIKGQSRSDIPEDEISTDVVSQVLQAANDASKYASEVYALYGDISDYASVVSQHDKRIKNLEQAISSSPFETDSSVAYVKSVPSNALPYAEIGKVGGMTYKSKNLIISTATTKTESGVTFTVNTDKSITVKGTATNDIYYTVGRVSLTPNTYRLSGCVGNGSNSKYFLYIQNISDYDYGNGATVTINDSLSANVLFKIFAGSTLNGTIYPMLNEGTTVFPYEPYYEGLRSAKVTEIKSVGANLIPFGTFPIHTSVQALDGYGESNPNNANEYNYIDFETQKFVAYGHIVDGSWVAYDAPVETDISDLITEDNFIEVEGGGTITMVNEHSLAVPSEITYMLKEETV